MLYIREIEVESEESHHYAHYNKTREYTPLCHQLTLHIQPLQQMDFLPCKQDVGINLPGVHPAVHPESDATAILNLILELRHRCRFG